MWSANKPKREAELQVKEVRQNLRYFVIYSTTTIVTDKMGKSDVVSQMTYTTSMYYSTVSSVYIYTASLVVPPPSLHN